MIKLNFYLVLYFSTHFVFGFALNSIGPIIPYLAELSHRHVSEYSFLFLLRGISFIVSGILHKTVLSKLDLHLKMLLSCFLTGLAYILFSLTLNILHQGLLMVFISLGSGSIEILIQICLLKIGGKNMRRVTTLSYGAFSLGMLSAPFLVILLVLKSFFWIGLFLILCSVLYWLKETPNL